eukprot:5774593-Amphidinium_carterae.2
MNRLEVATKRLLNIQIPEQPSGGMSLWTERFFGDPLGSQEEEEEEEEDEEMRAEEMPPRA